MHLCHCFNVNKWPLFFFFFSPFCFSTLFYLWCDILGFISAGTVSSSSSLKFFWHKACFFCHLSPSSLVSHLSCLLNDSIDWGIGLNWTDLLHHFLGSSMLSTVNPQCSWGWKWNIFKFQSGLPSPFFTLLLHIAHWILKMMACVVQLSLIEATQRRACASASTVIVKHGSLP